jgi:hypothetical protein
MTTLREAAQQALAFTMRDFATMRDFQAARAVVQDALRTALAQQAEPAPGWCKHCKQYSIEEPLPAQQSEPTQTPCDIAEDGVCEVIDCCRNPKQAEPVAWVLPDLLPVFSFKTAQLWKRPFAEDQIPLYTAPPQRKPLTEEEIYEMYSEPSSDAEMVEFARAIERAHGIGGDDEQA